MENDYIKGFYQTSKAWYGEANLRTAKYDDEIMIGFYHKDGGTSGEFVIKWSELSGKSVPRLGVYSDAWKVLAQMPELISKLSELDSTDPTPDDFANMLRLLGFKDLTQYENRDGKAQNPLENEIHEAWRFLRENNHSVSNEAIDIMKNSALEYINQ